MKVYGQGRREKLMILDFGMVKTDNVSCEVAFETENKSSKNSDFNATFLYMSNSSCRANI